MPGTGLESSRGRPDADSIGLGCVHGDAQGGDHKTKELNLLRVEQALLGFQVQVIFMKTFKTRKNVDPMNLPRVREDEDVVEVDHYEDITVMSQKMWFIKAWK